MSNSRYGHQDRLAREDRPTTYELTTSWGGYNNFMRAYGLKPGQDDEASAILDAFQKADGYACSENKAEGHGSDGREGGKEEGADCDETGSWESLL